MREAYAAQSVVPQSLRVAAFIDDMAAAYRWADLVVCRAGASTVAELAAVGLPAVFVPLPHATDRLSDALSVSLSSLTAQRLRSMGEATQALDARHALSRFLQQIQTIWPLPAAADQIQEGGA